MANEFCSYTCSMLQTIRDRDIALTSSSVPGMLGAGSPSPEADADAGTVMSMLQRVPCRGKKLKKEM